MTRPTKEILSKETVIRILHEKEYEGKSMLFKDFDETMKRSIRKHFGGYKNAIKELNLDVDLYKSSKLNNLKHSEEDLAKALAEAVVTCEHIGELHTNLNGGMRGAIQKRYGGFEAFAKKHGISLPPKKDTAKYFEEDIIKGLEEISNGNNLPSSRWLKENGYYWLVGAVKRIYGTWNEGVTKLGYRPFYTAGKTNWDKKSLIDAAIKELSNGCDPSLTSLTDIIRGFRHQVSRLFGSYDDFKREAGYCVIKTDKPRKQLCNPNRYIPDLKTKNGIIREITRIWYVGYPLNYGAVRKRKEHLLTAANKLFGSWENAVNASGLNYDDIKISDNRLSESGDMFEEILGEILTDLGVAFKKYSHHKLNPDFVTERNKWIDAKLSYWTDCTDMLKRYLPECEELTVVYLRGPKQDKISGRKYIHRKVSVYKIIEELDGDRRKYYEDRLAEIEEHAEAS